MIHFKFTRKNVRRLCVTMALIAPIIYLFGTMFTYLNGAHGDIVLAQPVYVDDFVPTDSYVDDGSTYKFVISDGLGDYLIYLYDLPSFSSNSIFFDYDLNGVSHTGLYVGRASSYQGVYVEATGPTSVVCQYISGSGYRDVLALPWNFTFSSGAGVFMNTFASYGQLYKYMPVPSSVVPENNSANTIFLFGQFFPADNFVRKIGEDAISESPHGFAPFGSLFRYIDQNALHMADTQVGLMAYGYMYWCAHVLLFDVLFMMTTFFISFIERVGDRLGGNE